MIKEAIDRTRVVIEGQVCIDRNILEGGSMFEGAGSPPMFINRILRQLGCEPLIIAPYGSDYLPYLGGVNIYPTTPNCAETLVYENYSASGMRTQRALKRESALPVPLDMNVINILTNADIVIVAPIIPNYTAERFIRIADQTVNKGVLKVLLPQGYFRNFDEQDRVIAREFDEAGEILPYLDVVIVSEEDHPNMLVLAKQWADQNKDLISVVTLGEKGALAFNNGSKVEVPTQAVPKAEIVDSVGCGDAFSAAFVFKYRRSKNLERAISFANQVARQRLFQMADQIKIDLGSIFC